jgi:hypothetical protein
MKITIDYEASWRNSFLDGDNNEPAPQKRKFIGSMTNLKKSENFIEREVTIDTVMGILNRLIGDQRKLYQARSDDQYYFRDIENNISFQDRAEVINSEITFIRNITGSTDQNSYTGMIQVKDPIFNSDYSIELWSLLTCETEELCSFILSDEKPSNVIETDPLSVIARLEELNKLKPLEKSGVVLEAFNFMSNQFDKFKGVNNKDEVIPISLYCSALYLQIKRLSMIYDTNSAVTKAGGLSGISNNGFTKKDFMSRYTTGEKKKIWGNPYMREDFVKGEGKSKQLLKKVSGKLEINLQIDKAKSRELEQIIESAGVSSFYLGKKGLAYVSNIRV